MQFKIIFIFVAAVAGDRLGQNRAQAVASHVLIQTRQEMDIKQKMIELDQFKSIIDFYAKTNPKMLRLFRKRLHQYYRN